MRASASSILAALLLLAASVSAGGIIDDGPTFPGVIPKPKDYQETGPPVPLVASGGQMELRISGVHPALASARRDLETRLTQWGVRFDAQEARSRILIGVKGQGIGGLASVADKPQGYTLRVSFHSDNKQTLVRVIGADPLGAYYGTQTLLQLLARQEDQITIRQARVDDWPTFTFRSFKGQCWYYRDNRMFVDWAPRFKWNVFGPCYTDCADWRSPPEPYRRMIQDCCDRAAETGNVRVMQLGNPYLLKDKAIRASSDHDIDTLVKFFDLSLSNGSDVLMLCLDDFAYLPDEDAKRFKTLAGANVHIVNRFTELIRTKYPQTRILVCPPPYWMPKDEEGRQYLRDFSAGIPKDIPIVWTGQDVTTTCHYASEINAYQQLLGPARPLFLWDNTLKMPPGWGNVFRMNPFLADCDGIEGSAWRNLATFTRGEAVINTYGPAEIYKVPLMTAADYLWNPEAYDPEDSLRRALYWFDENPKVGPMLYRWINDLHQKLYDKRLEFLKRPTAEDLGAIETLTRDYRSLADAIARQTKNGRLNKTLTVYKNRHVATYPYLAMTLKAYQQRSVEPELAIELLDRAIADLASLAELHAKGDIAADRDGLVRQTLETETMKRVKALKNKIK